MRVLVCGGRDFSDYALVCETLDQIEDVSIVIQGGAKGGDALGKQWANDRGIHFAEVIAKWDLLGRGAGPARNRAMLCLAPDLVVAFPGGSGTAHMVRIAKAAGIEVWSVDYPRYTLIEAGKAALK